MGDGKSTRSGKSTASASKDQARDTAQPSVAGSNSARLQEITGTITMSTPDPEANSVAVTIRDVTGAPIQSLGEGTPILSKVAGVGTGHVDKAMGSGLKGTFDDVSLIADDASDRLAKEPRVTLHPDGVPTREAPAGANVPAEEIEAVPITPELVQEMHDLETRRQQELEEDMAREQDAHNAGRAGDDAAAEEERWEEQKAYERSQRDKVQ